MYDDSLIIMRNRFHMLKKQRSVVLIFKRYFYREK